MAQQATLAKSRVINDLGPEDLNATRSPYGQPALILKDARKNRTLFNFLQFNPGAEHEDRDLPLPEFVEVAQAAARAAVRGSQRIGHTSAGDGATKIPIDGKGNLMPRDPTPEPTPALLLGPVPKSISPEELRRRFPEIGRENQPFRPFQGLFDFAGSRITLGVVVFSLAAAWFLSRRVS